LRDESLLLLASRGADVRIALSPLDALDFAKKNPGARGRWYGVGFETTTPHTAALLEAVKRENVPNLSVFSAHKTMPNALCALLSDSSHVDALLCPGHVASITARKRFALCRRRSVYPPRSPF
jgi:hydrogenase expression/formation protein HypD